MKSIYIISLFIIFTTIFVLFLERILGGKKTSAKGEGVAVKTGKTFISALIWILLVIAGIAFIGWIIYQSILSGIAQIPNL